MAESLVVYTVLHQPRRLRIPAEPLEVGAGTRAIEHAMFDEELDERCFHQAARECYYPAATFLLELVSQGFQFGIGFTRSFLRQAVAWDGQLLSLLRQIVRSPNVELVCAEPRSSFLPLFDLRLFKRELKWAQEDLEALFGVRPVVADSTEMIASSGVDHVVRALPFGGMLIDGQDCILGWRESTHVYHRDGGLMLLARHRPLSEDVSRRFSDRSWAGYPLNARAYSGWVGDTSGSVVFVEWPLENVFSPQGIDNGVFRFLEGLVEELPRAGVTLLTPSGAFAKYEGRSFHLPLPFHACAPIDPQEMDALLGSAVQRRLFVSMLQAYNKSLLTRRRGLIDLALWLIQAEALRLVGCMERRTGNAEPAPWLIPDEWSGMGTSVGVEDVQQVYVNFIHGLDMFL